MDFSCDPVKCLECGKEFPYSNGYFVSHIQKEHNLSLRQYVVKWEYGNDEVQVPRCQCGYCNDPVPFWRGKFLIGQKLRSHQNHEWLKEQYIKKHGAPICQCGKEIERFHRGIPRKFCNECLVINNHHKINDGVWKKGDEEKQKRLINRLEEKYGVINAGQLPENRENASKRMSEYNSSWKKNHTIKKYKDTELYYQSSFEYDFLQLCETKGILSKLNNGHSFNYLEEDRKFGIRLMTDFSIGDYEIEIKSSYIMKKQGGIDAVFAKKKAVENKGRKYLFLLDKDYSSFNDFLTNFFR